MFPSGYLIRPCEGGGCIIHVVDHYDNEVIDQSFTDCYREGSICVLISVNQLQPWSVPDVLRPLYESPAVLAQKSTIAVCSTTFSLL